MIAANNNPDLSLVYDGTHRSWTRVGKFDDDPPRVISGALLYMKEDFNSVDKSTILQEVIVSLCVVGAIFGAAIGGYLNDCIGRKKTILFANVIFFIGAIIMAFAPVPWVIVIGRVLVGLTVGMASTTSPLYISEVSPAKIRGEPRRDDGGYESGQ